MSLIKAVIKVIDIVAEYTGRYLAYLCIPTIAVIMLEVTGRYVFGHPFIWVHETTAFMVGILYTAGGAYVLKLDQHVSVDLLYNSFGKRGKAVIEVFTSLIFFIYMFPLTWHFIRYASRSVSILQSSASAWNPPVYPIKVILAVGIALVLLAGISRFIKVLHTAVTGREELWTLD